MTAAALPRLLTSASLSLVPQPASNKDAATAAPADQGRGCLLSPDRGRKSMLLIATDPT
jgi:hypothetical protein